MEISPLPCAELLHDDRACGRPAVVVDRWTWASTDGPTEHRRTRCLDGHVLTGVSSSVSLGDLPPLVVAPASSQAA